jgi:hypothetical protein
MDTFVSSLRRWFDDFDTLQAQMSEYWRGHTNWRTLAIIIVFGGAAIALYLGAIRPPEEFPSRQLVTVESGASLTAIADSLAQQHVIRSPLVFRLFVRILGRERGVMAGDYLFKQPVSSWAIARALSIGAFGLEPVRIRIPEGATTREMAKILSDALPRIGQDAFLVAARPQEGYLFPDTYFFLPNAKQDTVLEAMRQNFDKHLGPLEASITASGHTREEIVIMASIIEREARNPAARRMMQALAENKERFRTEYGVDVNIGVGINSGAVSVGNMGSKDNFSYTVIGDSVNLSSRLEGLTKAYGVGILTTRFTFDEIGQSGGALPPHRVLDDVKVKGKKNAVELIQVLDRDLDADGLKLFEEGRRLYRAQKWDEAITKLQESNAKLAASGENDGPCEVYLERCRDFKVTPPAPDWDGSWEMHSK